MIIIETIREATPQRALPSMPPPSEVDAAEIWYTEVIANFVNDCFRGYAGQQASEAMVFSFRTQLQQYLRRLEATEMAGRYSVPADYVRLNDDRRQLVVLVPLIAQELAQLWAR